MSKTLIWIVVIGVVVVLVLGASAVAGFFMYREYKDSENLAQAEAYRAEGDFAMASNYYRMYLSRNREDVETLRAFAEMNEERLSGRRAALTAAAYAYNQINSIQPDPALQDKVIALYEQTRSWSDVEYYANFFLSTRPDDPELQYKLALAIDSQGRSADAREAYRALIDAGTDDPQVYANLAGVLLRQGFPEEAAGVMAELEESLPDTASTYTRVGEYYTELRRYDEAEAYADRALALAPDYPDAMFLKAQLHLLQNRPDEAIAWGRKVVGAAPDSTRAHLLISVAQNHMNDHAGAIETLTALDPREAVDNAEVLIALAESQISANRLGDVNETIAQYRLAYPEMRLTLDYLEGRKALASGNASQAVTELTNVVELNPSFASAQYYLAVALIQSQQRDRGRLALEGYLQNHPNDQQARQLFDREFVGPQDAVTAEMRLRTLLDTATNANEIFAGIRPILNADATGDRGARNDLVVDALTRILELDPGFERAYQSLIFYYAEQGDTANARDILTRAAEAGIADEALSMPRAAVELTEGNTEAAKTTFTAALARQDFTVDKALTWGNLFATHGEIDLGLDALNQAVANDVGNAGAIIDLEKPLLLARHGSLDRALSMLDDLSVKYGETAAAQDRLIDLKLQFAQTLLRMPEPERQQRAEALLDDVARAEPNNPRVALVRAEHLLRQSPPRTEEAVTLLDRALALDKNNVRALVTLARIYNDRGDTERALDYGRRAANVAVGNLEAQLLVAQLLFSLQRHRECQETLDSLLAAHPSNIPALEMLAQSYIATRNTQLAQITMNTMVEAAGGDPEVMARADVLRSRMFLHEGRRLDEAEAIFRSQLESDPDNASLVLELATAVAGQGRLEEAEDLLTDYAEGHGTRPEGWYNLGRFYLDQNAPGLISKASSALTRARLIDPTHVPSLRAQIEAQSRQGKPVETLQLAERYLEDHPNDDAILFQKAGVLYQLSRMDEALETVDRALELHDQGRYRYLRAMIHLSNGRYPDALADLQLVELDGPGSANFEMAFAEAYWGVGDYELARQHFEAARRKNGPSDRVSPERLQRMERQIQENPAA